MHSELLQLLLFSRQPGLEQPSSAHTKFCNKKPNKIFRGKNKQKIVRSFSAAAAGIYRRPSRPSGSLAGGLDRLTWDGPAWRLTPTHRHGRPVKCTEVYGPQHEFARLSHGLHQKGRNTTPRTRLRLLRCFGASGVCLFVVQKLLSETHSSCRDSSVFNLVSVVFLRSESAYIVCMLPSVTICPEIDKLGGTMNRCDCPSSARNHSFGLFDRCHTNDTGYRYIHSLFRKV